MNSHSSHPLTEAYQRELSITFLPKAIYGMEICGEYIVHLGHFLDRTLSLDQLTIDFLISNLCRIIFPDEEDWDYVSERTYAFELLRVFELLVERIGGQLAQLPATQKGQLIAMAKAMRSGSLRLL
jgi:hypothetical protein